MVRLEKVLQSVITQSLFLPLGRAKKPSQVPQFPWTETSTVRESDFLQSFSTMASAPAGSDVGSHAGASHAIDGDPVFFQDLDHADVGQSTSSAGRERQSYAGAFFRFLVVVVRGRGCPSIKEISVRKMISS